MEQLVLGFFSRYECQECNALYIIRKIFSFFLQVILLNFDNSNAEYMLKMATFIQNQKYGPHICLLPLSSLLHHHSIILFYVFTFDMLKKLFMSRVGSKSVYCHFFSSHTIIS